MYQNIPVQHTTLDSKYATTSERVITTTIVAGVAVVVAVMLAFPLWMFSLRALGASDEMLDKGEGFLWLAFMLVPISSAGVYWQALFRLRSVKALRTWLETLGFCLLYWIVMPIVLGAGLYALQALQMLNQSTAISPGAISSPWVNLLLAGEIPGVILYIVLLALLSSGIGLGSALYFARWDKVREALLPSRGWLEFLLVLGCATVAALLMGLAFVYLTMLSLIPLLAAILAAIAAWTTYRTFLNAGLAGPSSPKTASGT
jgi:hypothetical protein